VRFLIWLVVGYLVYRMVRAKLAPVIEKKESAGNETFLDPVCGVYVSEADAVVGNMEGKRYHFCSIGCLHKFEKLQQQR
jgi:YHS domain-containing protein